MIQRLYDGLRSQSKQSTLCSPPISCMEIITLFTATRIPLFIKGCYLIKFLINNYNNQAPLRDPQCIYKPAVNAKKE